MTKTLLKKKWLLPDEMKLGFMQCNRRKVSHYLAGKICGHEIWIKWNGIDWVVLKGEGRLECHQASIISFTRPDKVLWKNAEAPSMARHKSTSGTLASRESYAFLYKQIKAREDLSSCGFKKQGSFLENKVVFELGSSRKKVCLRRRLNQFTSWINFMVLFFWNFRWERPGEALTLWKESISVKGKSDRPE
ncbi:unnamed protein product [Brassica oleracea]